MRRLPTTVAPAADPFPSSPAPPSPAPQLLTWPTLARRDAIAERLYTALLVVSSSGAPASAAAAVAGVARPQAGAVAPEPQAQAQKQQHQILLPEGAGSVPSLCSSDRAEAITDDGEPRRDGDDSVAAEAERIKAVLLNHHEKVAPFSPLFSTPPPPLVVGWYV